MTHDDAVQRMTVEAYLLGELSPPERDEFEEHFFGCIECAEELRVTAAFLEEVKAELEDGVEPAPEAAPATATAITPGPAVAPSPTRVTVRRPSTSPFAFLWRPAVLSPAFALALVVLVYQNAVEIPRNAGELAHDAGELKRLRNPSIPAELSFVGGNSRGGSSVRKIEVAQDQPLILSLDVGIEDRFASYACEVQKPSGAVVWRAPVTTEQAKDTVPIYVPAGSWAPGDYRLVVQGYEKGAEDRPVQITAYAFTLEGRVGAP